MRVGYDRDMRENVLLMLVVPYSILFLILFLSFFLSFFLLLHLPLLPSSFSSFFLRFLSFMRHSGSSVLQTPSLVSSKTTLVKQGCVITFTSYHRTCPHGKRVIMLIGCLEVLIGCLVVSCRICLRGKRGTKGCGKGKETTMVLSHAVCVFLLMCSNLCSSAPIALPFLPPLFPCLLSFFF